MSLVHFVLRCNVNDDLPPNSQMTQECGDFHLSSVGKNDAFHNAPSALGHGENWTVLHGSRPEPCVVANGSIRGREPRCSWFYVSDCMKPYALGKAPRCHGRKYDAMDLGAWPSYAVWQHLSSIINPSFYGILVAGAMMVEENDVSFFWKKCKRRANERVYVVTIQNKYSLHP